MPKVTVDGTELEVPDGVTVLQACELGGKEIPRFCYHERLSIAGNCRMCLVEVKPGPPKPQASCALPATDGQEIRTDSEMVKHAREGVMEFLLINHPLDCPICDQGGECDLQDQAMAYGKGMSRFELNKRAVTEKYMGPIVKTVMTRCIHCTRCVRFAEEVAGVEDIGVIGRGENMQITSYLEHAVQSELSGNVVDLCPVGALTSKPYAFEARPWELTKTLGIDVMDAVGTNIRFDARGREVLRVLPRVNDDVNEEWATDKARYAIDGLMHRRLDRPYVRRDGKLQPASWQEAFKAIADVNAGSSVAAIAGDLLDCETMYAAKALLAAMGSDQLEGRQTGLSYDVSSLDAVRFNTPLADIEHADVVLLIGSNPRLEAPLVNTRLRKAIKRGAKVYGFGPKADLTYKVEWLDEDLNALGKLPQALAEALNGAEKPAIIVGPGALAVDGAHGAALKLADRFKLVRDGWNGFNVLHTAASRMGGLMLGYAQASGIADIASARPKLAFFLGADEVDFAAFDGSVQSLCRPSWRCRGARRGRDPARRSLPRKGRHLCQYRRPRAARRQGGVRAGRRARGLGDFPRACPMCSATQLPFDDFEGLRAAMFADVPALAEEGLIAYDWSPPKLADKASGAPVHPIRDYYLTNAICRASETMNRCSAELVHGQDYLEAAE